MGFESGDNVGGSIRQDSANVKYGGFWIRLVAYIIDGLIIGIPLGIIITVITLIFAFASGSSSSSGTMSSAAFSSAACMICTVYIVIIIITWFYFAWFESSKYMGTPGKILLGLKVTDLNGNRISFGKAILRFFCKTLLNLFLFVGSLFIVVSEKKQGLYDVIAGTLVIKRN
jgi:uncharacterized RDD family membrane protein YckC